MVSMQEASVIDRRLPERRQTRRCQWTASKPGDCGDEKPEHDREFCHMAFVKKTVGEKEGQSGQDNQAGDHSQAGDQGDMRAGRHHQQAAGDAMGALALQRA